MQTVQLTFAASNVQAAPGDFPYSDVEVPVRSGTAYLDVTAHAGTTPTLNVSIEEKDEVSGKYMLLAAFVEVGETDSLTKLDLPAIDASRLRARAVINGSGASYTFSIGFSGKEGDEN